MAVLSVQNLDMEFGERTLFSGVSFEVGERDKIGFIGSNATGQTTLFKLITGELEPSSGGIYPGKNVPGLPDRADRRPKTSRRTHSPWRVR